MNYIVYAIGFFLITITIQYLLHKFNKNSGNNKFWTGTNTVVVICTLGLIQNKISYLAAVIGFILADEIGKTQKWH